MVFECVGVTLFERGRCRSGADGVGGGDLEGIGGAVGEPCHDDRTGRAGGFDVAGVRGDGVGCYRAAAIAWGGKAHCGLTITGDRRHLGRGAGMTVRNRWYAYRCHYALEQAGFSLLLNSASRTASG